MASRGSSRLPRGEDCRDRSLGKFMPLHLFKRGARVLPQRQAMLIATGCDQRNAMIFGDLIIKQVQEPFFNTISFAQDIENQRVGQIVFFGVHTYQNSLLKRGGGRGYVKRWASRWRGKPWRVSQRGKLRSSGNPLPKLLWSRLAFPHHSLSPQPLTKPTNMQQD
jgi:hypothetical protein